MRIRLVLRARSCDVRQATKDTEYQFAIEETGLSNRTGPVIPPFLNRLRSRDYIGQGQFLSRRDAADGHVGAFVIIGP